MASLYARQPGGAARPFHYGLAFIFVAAALGAREALGPAALGLQFITFFPAVALAAVFGGFGPGMLATALGAMLANWLYFPPYGAVRFAFEAATAISSLAFFLGQLLVCGVIEGMHMHYRRSRLASVRMADAAGRTGGLFGISRDVTEQRRVEADREQEHALLTGIMNGTDVMLVYLDRHFRYCWVNQAFASCCKMAPAAMVGMNHFDLYPDAKKEALFRRVRNTGEAVFFKDCPFEFPDQPGRAVTDWDWSLAPDQDAQGQLRGLVFSLHETTADVRDRQAVSESEQRFAALADAAPVLIWMSGPDHRCNWFNQQWLDFTGRDMGQELNDGWTEGVHPDDIERCLEHYKSGTGRRQPFTLDYRLRNAAGRYRWLTDRAVPRHSPDGSFLGYIGACADITERYLAEEALRESERKLTQFVDGAPAGIAMFDCDMRYLAASRRYLDDYHIADLDVIGRSHYAIFPKVYEQWGENFRRCLSGETQRCEEEACARPDGSVRWLRWEIRPWRNAQGEIGGIILFTENISARKLAEQELRVAKAEAEQANHAKSRFLAAASHDLRQPLSALGLYVGVLKHKLAPADAPLLSNMVNCVANLNELLSDLLDVSKLDAGVVTPELADFAVTDLLAGLAAVHAPEALLKGLRYRPLLSGLHARTDPVLFGRILGNLVANAVRYTERGGVLVGCRRRQGKTWIEVWDSGIGIPEDKIGEIFEEFRQLGNDERNRGSGLGLAIAAKAAALLGLQIRVRSRPGKGSMFAVELPLGQAGAASAHPAQQSRPLRIALVDDNASVLGALKCSLENCGHRVVGAASAAQLLERLKGAAPELVIADFRLAGGETGFDVIAAARAAFGSRVAALLITGDTDPKLMRSMTEHGIPVLYKPLRPDALQAAIAQALERRAPEPGAVPGSTPQFVAAMDSY